MAIARPASKRTKSDITGMSMASVKKTLLKRALESPTPAKKSSSDITPEARDTLLLTILCTAFISIVFSAFARDYNLAMYAMIAITVIASVAMVLVVLLARE